MVHDGRFYFTSELPGTSLPRNMAGMSHWYASPGNGLGDIYSVDLDQLLEQLSAL